MSVRHFSHRYSIEASVDKVWQALTDPTVIEQWGGGPAVMDAHEGTNFSLWGGDIFGTNTRVQPNSLLEQDWFGNKAWKEPSKVTFRLHSDGNKKWLSLSTTMCPKPMRMTSNRAGKSTILVHSKRSSRNQASRYH